MRILHINKYNHERDGVGRYMHDIMRLADAEGHATAVLAMHYPTNNPSPWEDFFVSNLETSHPARGIGALRQLARTVWSYEAYKKTRAIIAAFQPDVIHAHNLYTHLSPAVLTAARHARIPVVLTAHDYGYISANYGLFDGRKPLAASASWSTIIKTKSIKHSALATAAVDAVVRVQKHLGGKACACARGLLCGTHSGVAVVVGSIYRAWGA
jgi:Glycosyltransferase Family 4